MGILVNPTPTYLTKMNFEAKVIRIAFCFKPFTHQNSCENWAKATVKYNNMDESSSLIRTELSGMGGRVVK